MSDSSALGSLEDGLVDDSSGSLQVGRLEVIAETSVIPERGRVHITTAFCDPRAPLRPFLKYVNKTYLGLLKVREVSHPKLHKIQGPSRPLPEAFRQPFRTLRSRKNPTGLASMAVVETETCLERGGIYRRLHRLEAKAR